jgi:hypothetical protein
MKWDLRFWSRRVMWCGGEILVLGVLLALPWITSNELLRGLVDLDCWRLALATFLVVLIWVAICASSNLKLAYGELRFQGDKESPIPGPVEPAWVKAVAILVAVPCLFFLGWLWFEQSDRLESFLGVLVGGITGMTVILMVLILRPSLAVLAPGERFTPLFWPPQRLSNVFRFLFGDPLSEEEKQKLETFIRDDRFPKWIQIMFRWALKQWQDPRQRQQLAGLPGWLTANAWKLIGERFCRSFGTGYCRFKDGRPAAVLSGHAAMFTLGTLTLLIYCSMGLLGLSNLDGVKPVEFGGSPMGYLLFMLLLFVFASSGVSYFLDRYLIPWPIVLLVIAFGFSFWPSERSNHYYSVSRPNEEIAPKLFPTVDDLSRLAADGKMIIVSTEGGGIQAAAWTAKVLGELSEVAGFTQHVKLISGVSGGGVGMLASLHLFGGENAPSVDLWGKEKVLKAASSSSLGDVAWGLAFPDLQKLLLPFSWPGVDRSWALEQSFARYSELVKLGDKKQLLLSDLALLARQGKFPAVAFTATAVETGQPMVFSSSFFPTGQNILPVNFHAAHEWQHDVAAVTAARLAAGFPFVSLAARADIPGLRNSTVHLVDGGYYDNYGLLTANQWLMSSKTKDLNQTKVLVIQIRSFSSRDPSQNENPESWHFQLAAPITTLYNSRSTTQQTRYKQDFKERVQGRFQQQVGELVEIQYRDPVNCQSPPLSWHLTAAEKQCISNAWQDAEIEKAKLKIQHFLQ